MDKTSRPKLVVMEAGGNNADFYAMADACLFHRYPNTDYGKKYEEDNAEAPEGLCRKEIALVRERIQGLGLYNQVVNTIHAWRGHKAVIGNDATLMMLGYGRFFGTGSNCDAWNFNVLWAKQEQKLVRPMRDELNELVCNLNGG